ncbi:MAG: hypothetical protein IJX12_01675 [Lachnospiraceae bacterium]|nr:hypothetical protein [Lachnospiraceae bacterium]
MFKMWRKVTNDRGSITLEMMFIMPLVIFIIVASVFLLKSSIFHGEEQCIKNTELYVYSEDKVYGEAADNLRRWQVYGNVLRE